MSALQANAEQSMEIVSCDAYGPVSIPIADLLTESGKLDVNPEISAKDYFSVTVKRGTLTLRAGGYVGLIPINDRLAVQVAPRVPVSNLTRVLEVSGEAPIVLASTRTYETAADWSNALLDIFADQLLSGIERVRESGFIREYERREDESSFPRGRVLVHKTLQQQVFRGINHRAHCTWSERTLDVPANRCIRAAILTLVGSFAKESPSSAERRRAMRRLNGAFALFDGVADDPLGRFLTDPFVSGSRALPAHRSHYRDVLQVSRAIVERKGLSIERGDGPLRMASIVANMNYIFEGYVRRSLIAFAQRQGWKEQVLDGNKSGKRDLFDDTSLHEATPDIVVQPEDGSPPLVIEVKNVPIKNQASDRSHINQALAYALSYRAPRVVLVHPRSGPDETPGLRLQGRVQNVEVFLYIMDLNAGDLTLEERALGETIRDLISGDRVDSTAVPQA